MSPRRKKQEIGVSLVEYMILLVFLVFTAFVAVQNTGAKTEETILNVACELYDGGGTDSSHGQCPDGEICEGEDMINLCMEETSESDWFFL